MYSRTLGCVGCTRPGLGLAPLAILTSVNQVASVLGLNSSDPAKDQLRIERINAEFSKAMAGDVTAVECLRQMAQGVANNDGRLCAVGSQIGYRYAQVKWGEYQARHGAGIVGGVLIGQSDIPSQIGGAIRSAISNPLVIGAVVLGGYLVFRKRGR